MAERNKGSQMGIRWWEQAEIYLAGKRETATAAADAYKDGMEE